MPTPFRPRLAPRLQVESLEDRCVPHVAGFTNVPSPDSNPFNAALLDVHLQRSLARFRTLVAEHGGTATPTSGYRSIAYQQHLRDIYDKFNALRNGGYATLTGSTLVATATADAEDRATIQAVNAEIARHGLGVPPRVNRPTASAHTTSPATAVDITVSGVTNIDELACEAGLYRRYIGNGTREGQIHYELLPDGLDLVFVIDTTGSMSDDISSVKESAVSMVHEIFKNAGPLNCPRVGIVLYKDVGDVYVTRTQLAFTTSPAEVVNAINGITVGGGGDTPEAVYSALIHAIDNLGGLGAWRGGNVKKKIILFGDAPPHNPESGTGYTAATVALKAFNADPVDINTVVIGSNSSAVSSFRSLATQNRGRSYNPADASAVVDDLVAAIRVSLPPQVLVPKSPVFVTAPGPGGGPNVRLLNPDGSTRSSFFAYAPGFTGGVLLAVGDVTDDGVEEIVTSTGVGGAANIRVFDRDGVLQNSFFAYPEAFTGGVNVALGDVNNDGFVDIICGVGKGGGPNIRVLDGRQIALGNYSLADASAGGMLLRSFFAYPEGFTGGVRVSSADANGDGYCDIICGVGSGGGPNVRIFDGRTGSLLFSQFVLPEGFTGGLFLTAADVTGDGATDLVVGVESGGGPNVRAYDMRTGSLLKSFFAFDSSQTGGVRVGGADVNQDGYEDFVVGTGPGTVGTLRVFSGKDGRPLLGDNVLYGAGWTGGINIG